MSMPTPTFDNFSGKYKLNLELSDNIAEMFAAQGVSEDILKAASSGITVVIHEGNKFELLGEVDGKDGMSFAGNVDGETIDSNNPIFGPVKRKSEYWTLSQVENKHLKEAWKGIDPETKLVSTTVDSVKNGWKGINVLTIQEVGGEKRMVYYQTTLTAKGETVNSRVVNDRIDA